MKTLIRTILSSFSREPAPWLLASSALLAALLSHLPVPPFIFALGGSTSTTPCTCPVDNCKAWSLVNDNESPECHKPPWEECTADLASMVICPPATTPEKKMPKSKYTYEQPYSGTQGFCQNVATHPNTPESDAYEDTVAWKRDDVSVNATGNSGSKTIEFKPKLSVNFSGFEPSNVCTGSTGQIDIKSSLFASMTVCGESNITDPAKSTGWGFVTHTFKKDATGVWKFTGGTNPHTETFTIKKLLCACDNADDDPDQNITFKVRVDVNGGVKFGGAQDRATVNYYCDEDTTTCSPVNP